MSQESAVIKIVVEGLGGNRPPPAPPHTGPVGSGTPPPRPPAGTPTSAPQAPKPAPRPGPVGATPQPAQTRPGPVGATPPPAQTRPGTAGAKPPPAKLTGEPEPAREPAAKPNRPRLAAASEGQGRLPGSQPPPSARTIPYTQQTPAPPVRQPMGARSVPYQPGVQPPIRGPVGADMAKQVKDMARSSGGMIAVPAPGGGGGLRGLLAQAGKGGAGLMTGESSLLSGGKGLFTAAEGAAAGPIGAAVMAIAGAVGGAIQDNARIIGAATMGNEAGGGAVAAGVALDAIKKLPGPLGKVVGVIETVGQMAAAAFDQAAKDVKHFGQVAGVVVRGDLIEAAAQRYEKISEEKRSTPVIGGLRGGEEKVIAARLRAFQTAQAAIRSEVDKLAPYSGAIQGARAQVQAATISARVRSANAIGSTAGQYEQIKGAFDIAAEVAMNKEKNRLMNSTSNAMLRGDLSSLVKLSEDMKKLSDSSTYLGELAKDQSEEGKKRYAEFRKLFEETLKELKKGTGDYTALGVVEQLVDGAKMLDPMPFQDDPLMQPGWAQQNQMQPLQI